jgi:hypothetical protein
MVPFGPPRTELMLVCADSAVCLRLVCAAARALQDLGLNKGETVALFSEASSRWLGGGWVAVEA